MQTQTTLTSLGEGDRFALVLDRSTATARFRVRATARGGLHRSRWSLLNSLNFV